MSIKVIFVIPSTCRSEQECDPNMLEAYNIASNHDIDTHWIHANDPNIAKFDTSKTDIVVFQVMNGNFYQRVVQSKSVVVSPLCLLQCLKNAKPIPKLASPLSSLAMENCVVVCSTLPKESKYDLKAKVQAMAGVFCTQLVSDTTYLITNGVKSEKYHRAVQEGMKIMTAEFVYALWEAGKTRIVHAYNDEFQKYTCPPLLNLNICSTGFRKEERHIQALVENNGGIFTTAMDVNKTDILICKSTTLTSAKYKTAVKYKIDCVTQDWILDSVKKGFALPNLKDYAVNAAVLVPLKGDDLNTPNALHGKESHQFSATIPHLLEQTINMSYGNKQQTDNTVWDDIINDIDIKVVKTCGQFLDGCVIYVAGFKPEQKEKLCRILNFSGATSCFSLNDQITHAILGSIKCIEFKQLISNSYSGAIVNVRWLVDSMNANKPLNVDDYLMTEGDNPGVESPGLGTSSPLSKKGLNFLRSNVTLLKNNDQVSSIAEPTVNQNDDDLQCYFSETPRRDSVDDAIAAFSITNVRMESKHDEASTFNVEFTKTNASLSGIDVTMEESLVPIFVNLTFMILNYPKGEKEGIEEYIKSMQGSIVNMNFKGILDYAVVPIANQNLNVTAKKVVTALWVMDCGEQKKLITEMQYYHLPFSIISNVLAGLVITLSGFTKREKQFLSELIGQLGGVHQDWMSKYTLPEKNTLATTHLVLSGPSGRKYQGALKWGLPVVSKDWLIQCAKQGKQLAEGRFCLDKENQSSILTMSKVQGIKTKLGDSSGSPRSTPKQSKLTHLNAVETVDTNTGNVSPVTPASETFRRLGLSDGHDSPMASTSQPPYEAPTPNQRQLTANSQITPANEIMARVRKVCGNVQTPDHTLRTPEHVNTSMNTPETPYGAIFENPPPSGLRKKWKRWVDKMPEPYKSPGTPISEIKRQFWNKYYETHPRSTASHDANVQKNSSVKFLSQEVLERHDLPIVNVPGNDTEINNLVNANFDELENVLATGNVRPKRQSIKKIECDVSVAPVKDSQPMSVGWNEHMVIPIEPTTQTKSKHFMISGVEIDERNAIAKKLEHLGATISDSNNFDPSSTHLLCEKLNRNEKLLASMASGLWILHISYAVDSAAAGKLLNEEDYEFGSPNGMLKFKLDGDSVQRAAAASYWRQEINRRGYGAFHDIRAILHANKKEQMIRVLQAGGAIILEASPPFEENLSATHCFLEVKNLDLNPFIALAQQGILCINTLYINDFLQRTGQDINEFIVPGFRKYY